MSMTQKRVVPIDGSTVSHHAIITLAIRLSCSAVASRSHCHAPSGGCSELRRSISIVSFGKLRETFASCLRNQAKLGKVGSERIDQLRALAD